MNPKLHGCLRHPKLPPLFIVMPEVLKSYAGAFAMPEAPGLFAGDCYDAGGIPACSRWLSNATPPETNSQ